MEPDQKLSTAFRELLEKAGFFPKSQLGESKFEGHNIFSDDDKEILELYAISINTDSAQPISTIKMVEMSCTA